MNGRQGVLGGLATLVAVAALGGTATAGRPGVTLTGHTVKKHAPVELELDAVGVPVRWQVGPHKAPCKRGTLSTATRVIDGFDSADATSLSDKRKATSHNGPLTFRFKLKLSGHAVDPTLWEGSYKLKAKIFQGGDKLDTCKLKTGWSASADV